jgi:AcrR family transcriptional regulator
VVEAALTLLANAGPQAITFRAIARQLGGSVSLVTHRFSARSQIVRAVAEFIDEDFRAEAKSRLRSAENATQRLHALLCWLLPGAEHFSDPRNKAFLNLLTAPPRDRAVADEAISHLDRWVSAMLRDCLAPLVEADRVGSDADILRAALVGIEIQAAKVPGVWTELRCAAALNYLLRCLDLPQIGSPPTGACLPGNDTKSRDGAPAFDSSSGP